MKATHICRARGHRPRQVNITPYTAGVPPRYLTHAAYFGYAPLCGSNLYPRPESSTVSILS
jgi:hypothetical protein